LTVPVKALLVLHQLVLELLLEADAVLAGPWHPSDDAHPEMETIPIVGHG
jgi:hypothetical protein